MNDGMTPQEFTKEEVLADLDQEEAKFRLITSFSSKEKEEYNLLLSKLKEIHEKDSNATPAEKGKALENIVNFLIKSTSVFDVHKNIHTSTNEIDVLIVVNSKGKRFRNKGYLDINDDILLCECKNYKDKVGVSWVGKFACLLDSTNAKIGLLFSYHGLSGKGWEDGIGLTKKLYLSRCNNEKIYILDFNKDDFELIENGVTLLELIRAKIISLQTDTKIDHYIKLHPAQLQ